MTASGVMMELAERVASAGASRNSLDVEVEVAMFKPSKAFVAIRANAAGTKVIYTRANGNEVTCWAEDWTIDASTRVNTAIALRERALAQTPPLPPIGENL